MLANARTLARLGTQRQVLFVTHLAQVASCADGHVRAVKGPDGGATTTRLEPLSADERVDEIARMLGGVELTPQSLAHAQAMVAQE